LLHSVVVAELVLNGLVLLLEAFGRESMRIEPMLIGLLLSNGVFLNSYEAAKVESESEK